MRFIVSLLVGLMTLAFGLRESGAAMVDGDFTGEGRPDFMWFRPDCNGPYNPI